MKYENIIFNTKVIDVQVNVDETTEESNIEVSVDKEETSTTNELSILDEEYKTMKNMYKQYIKEYSNNLTEYSNILTHYNYVKMGGVGSTTQATLQAINPSIYKSTIEETEVAIENIFRTIFNKFVEWWNKFCAFIKDMFKRFIDLFKKKDKRIKDLEKKVQNIKSSTKGSGSSDSSSEILKFLNAIKLYVSKNNIIAARSIITAQLDLDRIEDVPVVSNILNKFPNELYVPYSGDFSFNHESGWDFNYWVKCIVQLREEFSKELLVHVIQVMKYLREKKVDRFIPRGESSNADNTVADVSSKPLNFFIPYSKINEFSTFIRQDYIKGIEAEFKSMQDYISNLKVSETFKAYDKSTSKFLSMGDLMDYIKVEKAMLVETGTYKDLGLFDTTGKTLQVDIFKKYIKDIYVIQDALRGNAEFIAKSNDAVNKNIIKELKYISDNVETIDNREYNERLAELQTVLDTTYKTATKFIHQSQELINKTLTTLEDIIDEYSK